ncbi:MAG: hypothetical protein LKJ90_07965 [Faecalibacterium sp.]|jgi:hypothetical protein|nr:hypothetical protein [Faecalibacterium sp.]
MAEIFIGGNPYTDPEANNVTDGSVDYYDFNWGDPVFHDESEMETNVINCDSTCPTPTSACGDNTPEQTDEQAYVIIDV